ncbi:polysaccharide lyase family 4 protein [Xylariaceae sp. FL0016]|nr:polysaccharide lyase family 4 protein [Xylariaceae sp. FL0016]
MKRFFLSLFAAICSMTLASCATAADRPFLSQVDNETWVIGNEVWNMTQGRTYGVKLNYKDHDCVGGAAGHYVGYNGAASNLNWTSASVVSSGNYTGMPYIDVKFTAAEGDMHWVIFSQLPGAYQYFVNHALPQLGEFRTLWRLDNTTFPKGKTDLRDEELPPLSEYIAANKVQDETWLKPDGSGYITKYDFTSWIRTQSYYGVYGDGFGSWYVNPGKDYYNGNHLKQELMVHRESSTGDAVQLNMIHGTHFQVSAVDDFPDGKIWGPWLWYLNDGSLEDVALRAKAEFQGWPYAWLDDAAYHARGAVAGRLVLSDGRPASRAAVFLGDNHPNKTALDMGSDYYYAAYADAQGFFNITGVRAATYGLQAWSNGSNISDVTTSFLANDVAVSSGAVTDLGRLAWAVSNKTKLFQVGDFDRTSYGFQYGGAPHQHALVANCPADLEYIVGKSSAENWCFAQSYLGNWTIRFEVPATHTSADPLAHQKRDSGVEAGNATLIVSLAGYSEGASGVIWMNDVQIGNMTSGSPSLLNDPSVYRSGTTAGEWRYLEFPFDGVSVLRPGEANEATFQLVQNTTWRGFMYDSIVLEW